MFTGDELNIIFLAGTEDKPTCKMENRDKIIFLGEFKENRGDEVTLEIQSDKNVVNSTSDLKWISVCNNATLDLLASLVFKMESSETLATSEVIVVTISFLIPICIVIIVIIIMRVMKMGKQENEENINENQLNVIFNESSIGED